MVKNRNVKPAQARKKAWVEVCGSLSIQFARNSSLANAWKNIQGKDGEDSKNGDVQYQTGWICWNWGVRKRLKLCSMMKTRKKLLGFATGAGGPYQGRAARQIAGDWRRGEGSGRRRANGLVKTAQRRTAPPEKDDGGGAFGEGGEGKKKNRRRRKLRGVEDVNEAKLNLERVCLGVVEICD